VPSSQLLVRAAALPRGHEKLIGVIVSPLH